MDANTLERKQIDVDVRVMDTARLLGLTKAGLLPIRDGVADESGYLASSLKVVWILKEPWDGMENGTPSGGGWSITKDCFLADDGTWEKDGRWKNRTWQAIAYVMYGVRTGRLRPDMGMIRNDHSIMNELKTVGWINASKMPNRTQSSDSVVLERSTLWREIVLDQIEILDPDVVIFGKTFAAYVSAFEHKIPVPQIQADKSLRAAYRIEKNDGGSRYLFDAMHPGRKGMKYCNSLIMALRRCREMIHGQVDNN